jgi:subtilisin-like proprotein convertase family protein
MSNDRRKLDYRTFDDLTADLQQLKSGCRTVGNWSLEQIADHLRIFFEGSLNGFGFRMPWYMRLGAPLILRYTLKKRFLPAGVKTPKPLEPNSAIDAVAVDVLLATIAKYRVRTGPLHPSPLFGPLPRETWDQVHLIHCAHHLSFAHPTLAAVAGGV